MKKTIYSEDHTFLIKQLKKARKESGLDQITVAHKLGRTQSYISKIESGQCRIDVIQLKEFAIVYRKDLDYFVKGK